MLFLKKIYQKVSLLASNFKTLCLKLPSSFFYSIQLFPLRWINFVSLSLLLFLSPAYGAFWLLIVTFYFLFKSNFKNIFIIWGLFLGTWYSFFIVCLSDYESQILIGGEHGEYTKDIMMYFSYKYSTCSSSYYWYTRPFQGFCYQTVILLHLLSAELGFTLYISSVFID